MKRLELSMLLALIFTVILSFVSFEGECKEIRSSVLRMHVLANSDSEEDQSLKLAVRDRLLKETEELFASAQIKEEAETAAIERISYLEAAAKDEIQKHGFDYDVKIEVGEAWFDTREYGNITLPAGNYEAVNVYIGKAEGKNWWCVMFPQLCLPAACGDELESVLTEEQSNITQGDYKVEFYLVELFQKLFR